MQIYPQIESDNLYENVRVFAYLGTSFHLLGGLWKASSGKQKANF